MVDGLDRHAVPFERVGRPAQRQQRFVQPPHAVGVADDDLDAEDILDEAIEMTQLLVELNQPVEAEDRVDDLVPDLLFGLDPADDLVDAPVVDRLGLVLDDVGHQRGAAPALAVEIAQPLHLAVAEVEVGLRVEIARGDVLHQREAFLCSKTNRRAACTEPRIADLPFTFNMVLTTQNQNEIGQMVSLAELLGSGGVRFGHLMPTPETALRKLDLSPEERRKLESEIWPLKKSASIPVGMAPGYFSEVPFSPCGPLKLEEYNLDYKGNLSLCCQLSGHSGQNGGTDIIGNLNELSLTEACERFHLRVATYLADKRDKFKRGEFSELDHFPCWYCLKYLGKTSWLSSFPNHPWNASNEIYSKETHTSC